MPDNPDEVRQANFAAALRQEVLKAHLVGKMTREQIDEIVSSVTSSSSQPNVRVISSESLEAWYQLFYFVPTMNGFEGRAVYHRAPEGWYRNGVAVDTKRTFDLDQEFFGRFGHVTLGDLRNPKGRLRQSLQVMDHFPPDRDKALFANVRRALAPPGDTLDEEIPPDFVLGDHLQNTADTGT